MKFLNLLPISEEACEAAEVLEFTRDVQHFVIDDDLARTLPYCDALTAALLTGAAVSAGGGARSLMVIVTLTGALVWAALPLRPRLRARVSLDPVLTPLALVLAAVLVPYAVDQLQQQIATTGATTRRTRTCSTWPG